MQIFLVPSDKIQMREAPLLITDLTMPVLSGLDLAGSLQEKHIKVPIILCTGYDEHLSNNELKALGINAVMLKPVSIRNFANMVRAALDGHVDNQP